MSIISVKTFMIRSCADIQNTFYDHHLVLFALPQKCSDFQFSFYSLYKAIKIITVSVST